MDKTLEKMIDWYNKHIEIQKKCPKSDFYSGVDHMLQLLKIKLDSISAANENNNE